MALRAEYGLDGHTTDDALHEYNNSLCYKEYRVSSYKKKIIIF